MISVISYGVGNIASIVNMVTKAGSKVKVCSKPKDLKASTKLILPGVGAFDHGMENLIRDGWIDSLGDLVITRQVPILGICLGMQMMCRSSDEGVLPGLGWVNAHVKKLEFPKDSPLKIPHMGWNNVDVVKSNPLITLGCSVPKRFYFVHSYHVVCHERSDVLATTNHGYDITASFSKNNIYGVQFHPEKSHKYGLELIRNYLEVPC